MIPAGGDARARAIGALQRGDLPAAATAYREWLTRSPSDAESWFNLGFVERALRNFTAALDAYAQALKHRVARPEEVHLNRAAIYADHLGDAGKAEAELQQALRLNPRFAAAILNLGQLHEDAGDATAAQATYERLFAAADGSARAIARWATIQQTRGGAAAAIERLSRALATPQLDLGDRAELTFAIAGALDAAGDYAAAWQAITAANMMAAATLPPAFRYDPVQHERLIDRLIALPPIRPLADGQDNTPQPLFIVGSFRSGSTLAEQILGRHSAIQVGGELETLPAMVHAMTDYPDQLAKVGDSELAILRARYLEEIGRLHPQAGWLTDKRQDNFLHIALIQALFPMAPIVHTRRDPLDTMLSIFFLYFGEGVNYSFDLAQIGHWFGQYRRLMAHWQSLYGERIVTLDYDALVADPAPVVTRLLADIGLPFEAQCLGATPTGDAVRTASGWQVRQPIHARSSGRWRNYPEFAAVMKDLIP